MYKLTRSATVLGVGLSISAFVGWLLMRESKRAPESDTIVKSRMADPDEMSEIPLPLEEIDSDDDAAVPSFDDLTEIRGIGPNYAQALHAIGITRFEQLAQETADTLAERLAAHATISSQRIRESDWIGQAVLRAQH
ncbi:helix-hairpin-helix domain-containing protein [Aggregatilinea lenta]|uniref:helix-hairpin-helix domain-containing protein n=1 Tax=Aggregatilinea lenta TaxID=913108 RepID=UPI000E5B70BA|nr:DUF4332 domain-containing protein [Aggregatilinea lenta]